MSQTERRPADAYFEMVELLGDSHFLTQPPSLGVELIVEGLDHISTVWAVTDAQAIWLRSMIHNHRHLRLVSSREYTSARL